MMKKEYNLEGIKCAGCANTVKERFSNVPGVTNVEVSLENKVATVEERFRPAFFLSVILFPQSIVRRSK